MTVPKEIENVLSKLREIKANNTDVDLAQPVSNLEKAIFDLSVRLANSMITLDDYKTSVKGLFSSFDEESKKVNDINKLIDDSANKLNKIVQSVWIMLKINPISSCMFIKIVFIIFPIFIYRKII